MSDYYQSNSVALRVHAGDGALDRLGKELGRAGVGRALLLCGRTLGQNDRCLARLKAQAEGRIAGVYAGIGKEAPLEGILAAVTAAKTLGADGFVALGAGSVLKAARVVAILEAESGPIGSLMTHYPENGPAVSPRLLAPKLPIINIPTAPSSAQARAGSAIAVDGGRGEFFDPKTRPRAIFWDPVALATAPPALARSTAFTVHWRALMGMATVQQANPLVRASRSEAWRLAGPVSGIAEPSAELLLDLCAAALLQNRDEDDGGRPMDGHWIARAVYALGASVFHVRPSVTQAQAYAALTPAAIRLAPQSEGGRIRAMAQALGLSASTSAGELADYLAAQWARIGIGKWNAQAGDWPEIEALTRRNFNADRNREFHAQTNTLRTLFETAVSAHY